MSACAACGADAATDLCSACLARAGLDDAPPPAPAPRGAPRFQAPPQGRAPRLGRIVLGFRIEAPLGAGAMGEVFVARRPDGARVAVKFAAPDALADPRKRARFRREGEALRRIGRHPGVVTIHAVVDEADDPCLVMELVEGTSVLSLLQRHGRLAPAAVARLGRDVAWGVAAVHARGLLHRDLKPANLMVGPDGAAKVVDFGIAKDAYATALTAPGEFLGTGPYTAPERLTPGGEVDQRCDVFSLGATLYHVLTGRPAFPGKSLAEVGAQLQEGRYPPIREVVPDAGALELVLGQMLAREPTLRYESMRACAEDLERVLQGAPPRVARLERADGSAAPLVLVERLVIGSGPSADLRLDQPSVSPQHCMLRREEGRHVLRDLKSKAGTSVAGEPLRRARALDDGDRVLVGEVPLTYRGPRPTVGADRPGPPRVLAPALLLHALARSGAPAVALALLERLDPPAWRGDELAPPLGAELAARLGPEVASRRARRARESALQALAALRGLAGDQGADGASWLAWWDGVQDRAGPQAGGAAPPADLTLRIEAGAPPAAHRLAGFPLTIGRDPRCGLRLEGEGLARRHATLVALHGRLAVQDEGSEAGTLTNGERARWAFLDPGAELTLGGVRLRLEAGPPAALPGGEVDELAFEALEELGHPSVVAAQVELLAACRDATWLEPALAACALEADAQRRARAALDALRAERAQRARAVLRALLGRDAGDDPAAWARLLGERGPLPPQVRPAGWRPGPVA